ncbi:MAG: hypothetical protein QOI59_5692 [Gammaproteobacteria bacterium]|jgi:hypothetical protein|nr:hypothetical protein [Gammaproteobacteria bacterium]
MQMGSRRSALSALWLFMTMALIGAAVYIACGSDANAQGLRLSTVATNRREIGGVVAGVHGPEAGVWVIAETTDLPTKFVRIVVTDDAGRFLLPDLPQATYRVWVRGYGLVDSPKVRGVPGDMLQLRAVAAPSPAAAAQYYPALYWYSLLEIPAASEFPGTSGNGLPAALTTQEQWLEVVKTDGCNECHQLGNLATRTLAPQLGTFHSSAEAWQRRILSGPASNLMVLRAGTLGPRLFALLGDWTDRIAAGALPTSAPARPSGLERNIVITMWDWARPTDYVHDEISTDRRHPTVNANGLIYGSPEQSTDRVPTLDPIHNSAGGLVIPVKDPATPSTANNPVLAPSPYWGKGSYWSSQTDTHNPMFDELGRVWFTSRIRPDATPAFCREGSSQLAAKLYPVDSSSRQLAMYDPGSGRFTLIDTCFPTHHLQFASDSNNTLWLSTANIDGTGPSIGWLNRKVFEQTHDQAASQGWTALVLDTNGNGVRDRYTEPGQPPDPKLDRRIAVNTYGIAPSPADGSIWGSVVGFPGGLVRITLGQHPPQTTLGEFFEPPWNDPRAPVHGFSPRGMDIDRNGVVWTSLASGHLASFDRRKCRGPLNGPSATGKHCPEGWTLYRFPGPQFQGVPDSGSAESSYYTWVDQFNTFGLGANVPIATGNNSDSLLAWVNGKFVTLRVPYPLGFFAKGMDGRIDDAQGGWQGRGLWSTYATRAPFHIEGGKGTTSKVVHFQLRASPLSR